MESDKMNIEEPVRRLLCTSGNELASFRDVSSVVHKVIDISIKVHNAELSVVILNQLNHADLYYSEKDDICSKKEIPFLNLPFTNKIFNEINDSISWSAILNNELKIIIKNAIIAPIFYENEIFGTLVVLNKNDSLKFSEFDEETIKILAGQSAIAIKNAQSMEMLSNFFVNMMEILVSVTESIKLIMPEGHCMNVAKLSTAIARELGFSQADYEQLYYASMLHDIGKLKALNLPLNKSDMFHAVYGAEMLTPINLLSKVSNIIKQHHECYDGSGFPEGL